MLPVVTLPLDSVRCSPMMISSASEPDFSSSPSSQIQRLAGILRAVAQAVEQLRGEGRVLRMRGVTATGSPAGRRRRRSPAPGRRPRWRSGASACAVDADRDAAQIFDQHEAQQRRQRPEFADLQRLDRLEALDDRLEHAAPRRCCRNARHRPRPSPARAARVRRRPDLSVGSSPVEAARQVALDLEDGFFDQIVVVEQPLRGRRDGVAPAPARRWSSGRLRGSSWRCRGCAPGNRTASGRTGRRARPWRGFRRAPAADPPAGNWSVSAASVMAGKLALVFSHLGRIRLNIH